MDRTLVTLAREPHCWQVCTPTYKVPLGPLQGRGRTEAVALVVEETSDGG